MDTPHSLSPIPRYGLAVVTVAVCAIVRWSLNPLLGTQAVFLPFIIPVLLSAWWGGVGPGLVALLLSAVVGVSPFYSTDPSERWKFALVLFTFEAGLVLALSLIVKKTRDVLQGANRAKDRLLAAVSHDLRNPLNAIAGWASQLELRPGDADFTIRAAKAIQHSTGLELRLVDDLLDLTRARSGKLVLHPEEVTIATIVASATDGVRAAAQEKGVELRIQTPHDGCRVFADPVRVEQVLTNLLTNAVKFTPAGGSIEVRVKSSGKQVAIEVVDSGIGIPANQRSRIFDPFHQVDESRDVRRGGLGLGLAIAKRIVELHGGSIVAENNRGTVGSTFSVFLPAGDSAEAASRMSSD
jgi:signal transduction histidine kinase